MSTYVRLGNFVFGVLSAPPSQSQPKPQTSQAVLPFADSPGFDALPKRRRLPKPVGSKWTVAPEAMSYLLTMRERELQRQAAEVGDA